MGRQSWRWARSFPSRSSPYDLTTCASPVLQEELYSYVTVSDDQTFKGKTNVTIESA
jgi:hypothetical protein